MLVLSRKAHETIFIGDDISITVLRIGPNTVRIGIEAPQSVDIVRDNVVKSLKNFNAASVGGLKSPVGP